MSDLSIFKIFLIGLIFVWSGFVRSGLGFGGAVLSLPFLLLILNDALIFLPIIAVHLLIFSSWIMIKENHFKYGLYHTNGRSPDWKFLKKTIKIVILPKMIGVLGLVTLPPTIMSVFIFTVVIVYGVGYILNKKFETKNKFLENFFLVIGGYVSGTSLTSAPLIIPVFANNVEPKQLRSTLFSLWFFLVLIKLVSLVIIGIDLQLIHHLWLFPCAMVGHIMGSSLHEKILKQDNLVFYRVLGFALIFASCIGFLQIFFFD